MLGIHCVAVQLLAPQAGLRFLSSGIWFHVVFEVDSYQPLETPAIYIIKVKE
jgi:hypothetical protein